MKEFAGSRPSGIKGIESRTIDFIPLNERHGRVWHQGPFWFAGNFNFFTLAIGFVGPGMGLGLWATVMASLFGILFGTVFMAFHACQGPELGLPQMVQSRAQFGYRGVIVALFGTLFTFLGFNVVDTVLLSQGLERLYGWSRADVAFVVGLVAVFLAIYGYDWLHVVFRLIFWVALPFYFLLTVYVLAGDVSVVKPRLLVFNWTAFAAQFAAAASYNITFAPYVSDYTRYLPKNAGRYSIFFYVYFGASVSAFWLVALGAWLAVNLGVSDGLEALNLAGNQLNSYGGFVLVATSVLALVAAMGLNAYSGMLTIVTALHSFFEISLSRRLRILCIGALAIVWVPVSLLVTDDAVGVLYASLSIMLYLLAPWTSVNLVDYFFVRRGVYSLRDLFLVDGVYKAWGVRGLISYAAGFLVGVPFFYLPEYFEGFVAKSIGGVDVAWFPEIVVSGLVYYVLMEGVGLSHKKAIQAAESDTIK